MVELLLSVGVFHWLALGLILLTLEVMLSTYDLLWISIAAFLTALAALLLGSVAAQVVVFAIISSALVFAGRTVFARFRQIVSDRPILNNRMAQLQGRHGVVTRAFEGGQGRVKLGDTEWSAELGEGVDAPAVGESIVVISARATAVVVRGVDAPAL